MEEENLALIADAPAQFAGALAPNAPDLPTTSTEVPVKVPVEVPVPAVTTSTEIVDAVFESESIPSKDFYATYTTAIWEVPQESNYKQYTICGGLEEDTLYACKTQTCPVDDIKTVCKPLNTCSCEL